jgi:hypothetical protein
MFNLLFFLKITDAVVCDHHAVCVCFSMSTVANFKPDDASV